VCTVRTLQHYSCLIYYWQWNNKVLHKVTSSQLGLFKLMCGLIMYWVFFYMPCQWIFSYCMLIVNISGEKNSVNLQLFTRYYNSTINQCMQRLNQCIQLIACVSPQGGGPGSDSEDIADRFNGKGLLNVPFDGSCYSSRKNKCNLSL